MMELWSKKCGEMFCAKKEHPSDETFSPIVCRKHRSETVALLFCGEKHVTGYHVIQVRSAETDRSKNESLRYHKILFC